MHAECERVRVASDVARLGVRLAGAWKCGFASGRTIPHAGIVAHPFRSVLPQHDLGGAAIVSARIDIIIPTWNGQDVLMPCLASLAGQTCRDFDVTVVDDGSTDGTVDAVHQGYPGVRVIALERNQGFCAAVNTGITATSNELIFLLNNDMTLMPDCLAQLVATLEHDRADMVAPIVLFQDEPDVVYSAGDCQRMNGRSECWGHKAVRKEFVPPDTVFGVSAGAALYRRAIFDRVGVLDEKYGAYFEDADLSFRARLAGFNAALATDAIAYHAGSASIRDRMWWRTQQCCRNHALLVIKNMPAALIMRNAPQIAWERINQMRRFVSGARTEFGIVRAWWMLLRTEMEIGRLLPQLIRERWAIQRSRQVSNADLEALLVR